MIAHKNNNLLFVIANDHTEQKLRNYILSNLMYKTILIIKQ